MEFGYATPEGTARFAARYPAQQKAGFYREAQSLLVSSLGIGTYLGAMDEATDEGYSEAVVAAAAGGVNIVDAAINYRHQRSERAIGTALSYLFRTGEYKRDEFLICTKAGFLTPGAIPATLHPDDVVARMHSMAPDFLGDQIDRSRANFGLETIDVFYLHNPEMQLSHVPRDEFENRIRRAFARLEKIVAAEKIRFYGTATWDGYRRPPGSPQGLNLARLVEIAQEEGGSQHHFRFLQLPFNLAMPEALAMQNQDGASVLDAAPRRGMTVVASATLLQSRLARDLPEEVAAKIAGLATDAQRAIQFTRSTPGISVALVGMSKPAHVTENLGIATVPPASREEYSRYY
jgi:aryl-alcohol dehydrogenase-like predicted oxidoreductase